MGLFKKAVAAATGRVSPARGGSPARRWAAIRERCRSASTEWEPVVVRVDVPAELYAWAEDRSAVGHDELVRKFPKLEEWQSGELATLKQLENFARATRTPIGFFFLPEPPDEEVPIPDFRTIGGATIARPSTDLLDTIYQCEQRQAWYRDYAQVNQLEPVPFVGSFTTQTPIEEAAGLMSDALDFSDEQRGPTWSDAFTYLRDQAEDAGVLVMVNGVVGSNTHRKLDPNEFRGFALVDPLAPVVFVNGADTKAAQIFTLAHELAHIWLGETALSDADLGANTTNEAERWCNGVAAELLVPLEELRAEFRADADLTDELNRLAKLFKASTLVVLRRVHEADHLSWQDYRSAYESELERVMEVVGTGGGGGNFYNTQPVRVSRRFARSVIESTLEGQTLHTDAFQLLGFKKVSTLHELGHRLGVVQ